MRPLLPLRRNNWFLVCMAISGCAAASKPDLAVPEQIPKAATRASNQDLAQLSDPQRLQVDRVYKGQRAAGLAVLKPPLTMAELRARHEKLAGARAWLSLAAQRAQTEDWPGAVECTQAG